MKKSILFVINTLGGAGAERALINLMRDLSEEKYDIDLMVMTEQGEMIREIPEHVHLLGKCRDIPVLSADGRKSLAMLCLKRFFANAAGIRLLPYMTYHYRRMKRTKKIMPEKLVWRMISDGALRTDKFYDLAVAYIEGASTYYVADHVNAASKIAFVHVDYRLAGYNRELDRDCYDHFNRIFTVSKEITESFLSVHPETKSRIGLFENIIDQDEIRKRSQGAADFGDDFDGIRIVSLGRITAQKAYDISIQAMKILKGEGIRARWYVIGDGIERDNIESLIRSKGLETDFVLMGAKDEPYPYLRECDIFVHASRFEGKSIALQEAKTLGCAIVATDVSGNREQITDGVNGILCNLSAEEEAFAIKRLIDDKGLRERISKNAADEDISAADPEKLLFS